MPTEYADVTTWLSLPGYTNTQAFQAAIDYMYSNYGGGFVFVPPGTYHISGLVIKGGVILQGSGYNSVLQDQNNDTTVISFDSTCTDAALRDFFIVGYTNAAATQNTVTVAVNVPVHIRNCRIWGGMTALFNDGVDGTVEDCFISGWKFGSLVSNGANWYRRVKFDVYTPCSYGFYQGTPLPGLGVMENHFDQCDFSGSYSASIGIFDGGTQSAISVFTGCVFSAPIVISQSRFANFTACEFGSGSFSHSSGGASVIGSMAMSSVTFPATVMKTANYLIA